jgi:Domain of unknown function (DUF4384)
MTAAPPHLGELALRRLFAGETVEEDSQAHAQSCGECRARLRSIEEEQRRFEKEIPFERFASGVERAARAPAPARRQVPTWVAPLVAVAAICVLVVSAGTLRDDGRNRLKGGADISVVVAAPALGPQRVASSETPEPLVPGERIRIGYQSGGHRYVTSISIDERGEVTRLYPERGASLLAASEPQLHYLPESVEFTGAGTERLIVVLSDNPLDVDAVAAAASRAFELNRRDLSRVERIEVPGEQFHRTFLKP